MDLKTLIPALSFILAAIGALGIAYAVFRSATVTKTMELYKLENEALGKSVARLQADQLIQAERITTLENENKVLKDVVTGKSAVDELQAYAEAESRMRREAEQTAITLLRDILAQLKDMWGQLQMRPGGRVPGTGEIGRA